MTEPGTGVLSSCSRVKLPAALTVVSFRVSEKTTVMDVPRATPAASSTGVTDFTSGGVLSVVPLPPPPPPPPPPPDGRVVVGAGVVVVGAGVVVVGAGVVVVGRGVVVVGTGVVVVGTGLVVVGTGVAADVFEGPGSAVGETDATGLSVSVDDGWAVGDKDGVIDLTGVAVFTATVVGGGFEGSISVLVLVQAVGSRQITTSTMVISQQYFWNLGILILPGYYILLNRSPMIVIRLKTDFCYGPLSERARMEKSV